jgi:tetratricopeptide (TPR) repeat protein
MSPSRPSLGLALFALAAIAAPVSAEEPARVVLQNGRSIPVSALALQGDKFVVKTAADGFEAGQAFPLQSAYHIYGDRPAAVNQAVALLLTDKPKDARQLLLPVVSEQRITARIPGNFWLNAARALLVAHALNGEAAECAAIGKEISEATPAQGIDPFVFLGKALLMPASSGFEDRQTALLDLITDTQPADMCAYASFFRGSLFKKEKKTPEALEAYLVTPCLYPTGGLLLNAAAELQAADLLAVLGRREEALILVKSALRVSAGTVLADEANKLLANLK